MGRKINSKKRQRLQAIAKLETEVSAEVNDPTVSKADEDLFVLDTVPDAKTLRHETSLSKSVENKREKKEKRKGLSEIESRKVRKILESATPNALAEELKNSKRRTKGFTESTNFDLWGGSKLPQSGSSSSEKVIIQKNVGSAPSGTSPCLLQTVSEVKNLKEQKNQIERRKKSNTRGASRTVAVEPAKAGQSYRPDPLQHQDAIGEALAIEIHRNEASDYASKPLSSGMSAETIAVLCGDSDDSSSDSDSDSEDPVNVVRINDKFKDRAARNRQKRIKAKRVALEKSLREKKFLNSLLDAKVVAKTIRKEKAARMEKKRLLKNLKQEERERNPPGANLWDKMVSADPLRTPALPVALSEELKDGKSSLRRMRPKQSELLKERIESMADRNMVFKKKTIKKNVVAGKKRKSGKGREVLLF